MPRLFAESGKMIGQDFTVTDNMVLGRKQTCHVIVDDPKSSREHTRILKEGGMYYVQDLNSSNGTYLNEVRIDKSPLVFGDKIRIGETVLIFMGDPEQNLEGQTVGGFQIMDKLGHRDIGIVYRARQIALDRVVALKVLDKDLSNDSQFVKRFIEEARAAGTLRHPNIIHVFDVGRANEQYYICMEYVSGKTLRDTMMENSLSLEDKVRVAKECASALAFAHDRNIIHKDVTPSNIILTEEKVAKVADMGIAKLADTLITSRDVSSLHYISPEEALGKPLSPQSDIYSLGICVYEMLTGRVPFRSESARDIIKEHITTHVPSPRDIIPEIPESLAVVCLHMTAIETSARYSSMKDVIADIEKIDFTPARQHARKPARQVRSKPRPASPKPVFVDDGRPAEAQPKRRLKVKTPGITLGFLGLILLAVFLVILFFITSFVTKLMLQQFSNRPTTEQVEKLLQEKDS